MLYIKQKVFTIGDKFSIYDVNGNEMYTVQGEVFTLGKRLHLYDTIGNELAYIEQKLFNFLPTYDVYVRGMHICRVIKKVVFFSQSYDVVGLDWQISGDFFAHNYDITKNGALIASVNKEWFTLGDSYKISFGHGVDTIAALAVVLVIDACIDSSKD